MSAADKTLLERVFAAQSSEESRKLYDEWASTYDAEMAEHDFTAPKMVAEGVVRALKLDSSSYPLRGLKIVDAGCGTGLVGVELARLGADHIDGLDLSRGMLDVARKTGAYGDLSLTDLTKPLEFNDGAYDALTCCGTFTHGHLGPEPLEEMIRIVKVDGVVVVTVLDTFWTEKGFETEVERLAKEGKVDIIEKHSHAYRKDAGGGRVLILRKL